MEKKTARLNFRTTPSIAAAVIKAAAAEGRTAANWLEKAISAALPKGKRP